MDKFDALKQNINQFQLSYAAGTTFDLSSLRNIFITNYYYVDEPSSSIALGMTNSSSKKFTVVKNISGSASSPFSWDMSDFRVI
jgi:hypothetical protein